MRSSRRATARRAFTLAEVTIAASITLPMVALTLGVVLSVGNIHARTDIKDQLDGDFRKVVSVLMENGRVANSFAIYKDFESRADADRAGTNQSGDLVVFTFRTTDADLLSSNPNGVAPGLPVTGPRSRIHRVLGVYRDASYNNGFGAIRWFDSDRHDWGQTFSRANPAPAGAALADLLPAPAFRLRLPVLAEMTLGAVGAGSTATQDSNLFYNLNGGTFTVNGLIYKRRTASGGTASGGGNTSGAGANGLYDAKNIFNITVTPRS